MITSIFINTFTAVTTATDPADSPHGVEVVIRGNVVLIVAGQAELVAVALMDKVPQLFGAQWLSTNQNGKNLYTLSYQQQQTTRTSRSGVLTLSSRAFCHSLNIIM